ncbi:MAG: dockerin type I domain-containing protein [Pirellulaceae bacterium]|nr:dockerin type I domain-containing protein [Pirellulaceae bacterium]
MIFGLKPRLRHVHCGLRRLRFESLENRRLLAADTTHLITGTDADIRTGGNEAAIIVFPPVVDATGQPLDSEHLVFTLGDAAESGTVSLVEDGKVIYQPNSNFFGTDAFSFFFEDGLGLQQGSEFTIDVEVFSRWQNPHNANDVNDDGFTSPIDLLLVINELNLYGPHILTHPTTAEDAPPPYLDRNGDGHISLQDAILIIECMNSSNGAVDVDSCTVFPASNAEGESQLFGEGEGGRLLVTADNFSAESFGDRVETPKRALLQAPTKPFAESTRWQAQPTDEVPSSFAAEETSVNPALLASTPVRSARPSVGLRSEVDARAAERLRAIDLVMEDLRSFLEHDPVLAITMSLGDKNILG